MRNFKEGQKVVCLGERLGWHYENQFNGIWFWKKQKKAVGPAKGDVVTVHRVIPGFLYLKEYINVGRFGDIWFEPLQENVTAIELVNKELCKN